MSLATRCTACGTVFRVVQDQLKVSEGWVRCGRCQEVFNALESLFDLDREAVPAHRAPAPAAGTPAAPAPVPTPPAAADAGAEAPLARGPTPPAPTDTISIAAFTSQPVETDAAAGGDRPDAEDLRAWHVDDSHEPAGSSGFDIGTEAPEHGSAEPPGRSRGAAGDADFADARFHTALLDDAATAGAEADAVLAVKPGAEHALDGTLAAEPESYRPSFVEQADRDALWRRPGVRRSMMMIIGALTATLLAQVAIHFHDGIAARWPPLEPTVQALCALADCEVEAPRRLDAVSVDSSGLARIGESDGEGYRLSVTLRNNAAHPVAPPSIELSLTNSNGQLIARRVLAPSDFAYAPSALPPQLDTPLQTVLLTGGERVSGYTIEVFYP